MKKSGNWKADGFGAEGKSQNTKIHLTLVLTHSPSFLHATKHQPTALVLGTRQVYTASHGLLPTQSTFSPWDINPQQIKYSFPN